MTTPMVPHSDWVVRQLERKIDLLSEQRERYRDLFRRLDSDDPIEREIARQSIVPLWNQIRSHLDPG